MTVKLRSADWYHYLPAEVKEILSRLGGAGHTTYLVGGAVRDLLLGLTPKDFDLVSSAKPQEIAALFEKTLEIGKQFGISVVVLGDQVIEVATFRKETTYSDGRHPDRIEFATPEEDAQRRDLTINGLFWDPENKQVLDHVDGLEDIDHKIIRCIGDAGARFQEDALRMLRVLRFYSALKKAGFSLDSAVLGAITTNRDRIKQVSRERITEELGLLLKTAYPSLGLGLALQTALWPAMFPVELKEKMIPRLDALSGDKWLGLALCVDPSATMLNSLALGREARERIKNSLKLITRFAALAAGTLAEQKTAMIVPAFDPAAATACQFFSDDPQLLKAIQKLQADKERFQQANLLNPAPLVDGEDLRKFGIKPGPAMGAALRKIRTAQLNEEIHSKEEALQLICENR